MITTLANDKDQSNKLDTTLRTILMVGQAVNVAVERFVATGEAIADDNPEIKVEMYDACKDARAAGAAIEKICEVQYNDQHTSNRCYNDRNVLIRAARGLLASVTRVLLLADTVVVKQLLATNNKAITSLNKLENVVNFTEFAKAFSLFGNEMVEFSSLIGDKQNELKSEKRRAQIVAAGLVLQRSATLLLTSSKTCLRHMDCQSARENRDTVFCQMRKAMDLIHFVVKDGVIDLGSGTDTDLAFNRQISGLASQQHRIPEDWDNVGTVQCAIKKFEDIVQMTRMTLVGPSYRGKLTGALDTVVERTQDFTDSAYTSHEHRENILLLCDRTKLELNQLLRIGISMDQKDPGSPNDELEASIVRTLRAIKDVKQQLQDTALDQASDLLKAEDMDLIGFTKNAALASDASKVEECAEKFHEHVEHIQEVCKLLRHVSIVDSLQVAAKHSENNIKVYGPQVLCAAHTLCLYPTSKTAKENLEMFIETWQALVSDVMSLSREVGDICRGRVVENHVYMSLPRPGKHGTTTKPLKPASLDSEEQAKIAESGLEMKKITSEIDAETEKWEESDSDVVKRAKAMSGMAFAMYQFTRGEGELKTTQDLFTQAEFFTEEANKMYKVVRQFSYQVPGGQNKKELLEYLDKVPTFVQQLQFTVKNPTVGKAATFTKVDNVIQETKNLMNVISKVVTTCFVCATKFNIGFPNVLVPPMVNTNDEADYHVLSLADEGLLGSKLTIPSQYNLDFNALTTSRRSSPYEMDGGASGLSETSSGIGSKGGGSSSDGNM